MSPGFPLFRSESPDDLVSDSTSRSVPSMTAEIFPSRVKSQLGMFHKKSRKFWRNRWHFRRKERKNGSRRPIFPKCTNLFRNPKMNHPTNPTNLGEKKTKKKKKHRKTTTSSWEVQEPVERGGHSVFPNPVRGNKVKKVFFCPTAGRTNEPRGQTSIN